MAYETVTYTELNRRMGDEAILQSVPVYTVRGDASAVPCGITAYVPVSADYPIDVPYLEQRLHEQWTDVEIILVTDVPHAQIWKVRS